MTTTSSAPTRPWEYSAFPVTVTQSRQLSPGFRRITLAGPALRHFAEWGLDQRIKLVLPMPDGSRPDFGLLVDPTPHPSHWYARWKELPEDRRNALRTYTPAAIRPEVGEIDVDVFLHQPAGPASTWAATCAPGDELVLTGPDARAGYTGYGIHYTPPEPPSRLLLVGDASALPAIRNILAALAPDTPADVFLELADPADNTLDAPAPGARIRVVEADSVAGGGTADDSAGDDSTDSAAGSEVESSLERAVREWGASNGADFATDHAAYAWIAGESGATTRLRRYLTADLAMPKDRVAFLGYWKLGGPLVG
ncbi:siderophore-interacting protein [Dietzia psychralcaliphila]|uniref:siderophore-interacting protein n=1 Tax=Dietzia psychralcaliphila TaxID=139021 RepID=UPI001C1DE787|nr:siderophore-interacting protein [Dietzia psychralcaliphila]